MTESIQPQQQQENISPAQTIPQTNSNSFWKITFLIVSFLLIILLSLILFFIIRNQNKPNANSKIEIIPTPISQNRNQKQASENLKIDEIIYSIENGSTLTNNRSIPQVDIISVNLTDNKQTILYSSKGTDFYFTNTKYYVQKNIPHLIINMETKLIDKNLSTGEIKTIFDAKNEGTIPNVLISPSNDFVYFTIVDYYVRPPQKSTGAYIIYKYNLNDNSLKILLNEKEGGKLNAAKVPYKFSNDGKIVYYRQYYPAGMILTFWQSDPEGNNFKDTNLNELSIDNKQINSKIEFFDSGEGLSFCNQMTQTTTINNGIKINSQIIVKDKDTSYVFLEQLTPMYSLLQKKQVIEDKSNTPELIINGRKCAIVNDKFTTELLINEENGKIYNFPSDNPEIKQITNVYYALKKYYTSALSFPTIFSEYILENGKLTKNELLNIDAKKNIQIISLIKDKQPSNANYFEFNNTY